MTILHAIGVTEEGILFEYNNQSAQSVFLVGSMNDWNINETPMNRDEDGVWRIFLSLEHFSLKITGFNLLAGSLPKSLTKLTD